MTEPLVTILTPVYNHEKYLDEYFESIINQTYKNIELVLIDDASTDQSIVIIEKWLPKLKERFLLRYLARKENKGLIYNCNEGLNLANGKYMCLFASDDIMFPTNIEEKTIFLESNSEYAMVYSNIYAGNNILDKKYINDDRRNCSSEFSLLQDLIDKGNFIPAPTAIVKREILIGIGGYNKKYYIEDYPTWLEIAKRHKVAYLNKALVFYRLSPNSLSSGEKKFKKMIDSQVQILEDFGEKYKIDIDKGLDNIYISATCYFYFNKSSYYKEYREKIVKKTPKIHLLDIFIFMKIAPRLIIGVNELYKKLLKRGHTGFKKSRGIR
ncbi:glycosyltransferase family 2 protein [Psychrobacillus sp. FSL K6-1415]|uniref:glycosyltransferase family 2 protein n=1 Tax=Psychrobacillus sp. FSL K6-1415 TaxID=2921544 RepID=UPI0030FA1290